MLVVVIVIVLVVVIVVVIVVVVLGRLEVVGVLATQDEARPVQRGRRHS